MSSTDFELFAEAVADRGSPASASASHAYENITVLGGGPQARVLAALCLAAGKNVQLFSAYGAELDSLRNSGGITLRGDGPVGTFSIDQTAGPSIRTTAELDRAVADADLIMLTGPVHKQRTYAMVLADHLRDGQTLLIAPARTFGALEVVWHLQLGGCAADVSVIEMLTMPHAVVQRERVLQLSAARAVTAAIANGSPQQVQALGQLLGEINLAPNLLYASFADASGLVEVPALLLGGAACLNGQPVVADGGVPLAENNTFRNLLGAQHLNLIEGLATERRSVAARYGVRDLPSTTQWLDVFAGDADGAGSRAVPQQTEALAMIRCAVTGSLAPLVSAAQLADVAVPLTQSMLAIASGALGSNVATAGRKLESLGVDTSSLEVARRSLENRMQGDKLGR